jgi:hypothetical protein
MALIVEDGTGLETADALVSLDWVETYLASLGDTTFAAATEAEQEAAIRQGTEYVGYAYRFRGVRLVAGQALAFPRALLADEDGRAVLGVPTKVKQATAKLALRALSGALAPDPTADDTGGTVVRKREKVGPLEEETQYSEPRGVQELRAYPEIDRLLREYTISGISARLERT